MAMGNQVRIPAASGRMATRFRLPRGLIALALVFAAGVPARAAGAAGPEAAAAQMVRESGAAGGICAVVGATDAGLALAIARQGPFLVHCLCPGREACDRVRKEIRARGLYGTVSAEVYGGGRLPYAENLVNLVVVAAGAAEAPSPEEVARVLAPLGTAYVGASEATAEALAAALRAAGLKDAAPAGARVRATKPWPADIDEWGHYLHGADGNPVAQDRVVGPPRHLQWVAGPLYLRSHETDSTVSTLVTAHGRLFSIVDEAPISLEGDHPLPSKWVLIAQDAFNGVTLWKVPIRRWGWQEWKETWFNTRPGDIPLNIQKRLVAAGDRVYVTLGYRAPISELDARTGDVLKTYAGTEGATEILYLNGMLVLSLMTDDGPKVAAVDASSGKRLWITPKTYRGSTVDYIKWTEGPGNPKTSKLDPALNIATDGKVVALIDGPQIVGLDCRTGAEKWHAAFPSAEEDQRAGGIFARGNLWIGAMIVSDGVVVAASPNKLAAFAADTGKLLWEQPKKYIGHLWYEWKDVFVVDGLVWTWSAELERTVMESGKQRQGTLSPKSVIGYDLKTGAVRKEVPLGSTFKANHHHRCYRNKATVRYIIASRRGSEFVSLAGGKHTVDNWVRGTCHVGMMPANGLHYAPPHPCQCYIEEKLNGFHAIAPELPPALRWQEAETPPEAERGPAYGKVSGPEAGPADWPAFRHDGMRSGATETAVPEKVVPLWRVEAGGQVSPPIAVGDRVYAALPEEHHVICLSAKDGKKVWEFAAGGRVDSPPTYHKGMVLFGSADGWVYCLRAGDGALVWRFRAAPVERLVGAFGQLESAWPVSGSVLILGDTVYFAAGRSSHLDGGLRLYGLDAATGKLLHQAKREGPRYDSESFEVNFGLPQGTLPDILVGEGTSLWMRTTGFDEKLQPKAGRPELRVNGGYLDASYFKRMPWQLGAGGYARVIVRDKECAYYLRMFDSLRGLDPTVYFVPGKAGYLLFAQAPEAKQMRWSKRIPIRGRALAVAGNRLFVAGPPDVVDTRDPLGAFEGRKGGLLWVFDTATGEKLAEQALPSPAVFNGAAAANGRLYLSAEDGSITCFGRR